jgi:hypothetical protein
MQQAHAGGDGAGGKGRADSLDRGGGDREGRDVLVEVPGRDDQIPGSAGAVVSHEVSLFLAMGELLAPGEQVGQPLFGSRRRTGVVRNGPKG